MSGTSNVFRPASGAGATTLVAIGDKGRESARLIGGDAGAAGVAEVDCGNGVALMIDALDLTTIIEIEVSDRTDLLAISTVQELAGTDAAIAVMDLEAEPVAVTIPADRTAAFRAAARNASSNWTREVFSPVTGTVNRVLVPTLGGVAAPALAERPIYQRMLNEWVPRAARRHISSAGTIRQIRGLVWKSTHMRTGKAITMIRPIGGRRFAVIIGFMGTGKRRMDWEVNFRFSHPEGFHAGFLANTLTPFVGDGNTNTPEFKTFLVKVEKA